ncbi:MAG: hypothetical protein HY804_07450 [Nitrospinae bacterium]|nr:hypothetical protein [Nitrospinota bacterium]
MFPTAIYRFSQIVVLIGYIIIVPSIVGMLIGGNTCIASFQIGGEAISQARDDSAVGAGAVLGTTLGVGISLFIIISSLVGGLVGYLLIMKKKVFKCNQCGFIMDRD